MRKSYFRNLYLISPFLLFSMLIVSCSSTKKIKYFQDIPDSGKLKNISSAQYNPPVIQVDDILTILIETIDPQATAVINMGNVPVSTNASQIGVASTNQQILSGYLVDKEGFVDVPVLGKIKLVGFTTEQAAAVILTQTQKYYKDPSVIVRYANFKISITGEVQRPGEYTMPSEKVSILDAIAMAGDLTIYGKRNNILLIRESEDGQQIPYRIDLTKSDFVSSPCYYLKQNDLIYIEPARSKIASTDAAQTKYFAIFGTILSLLIVYLTRTK